MQIYVIDIDLESRQILVSRVNEALRQLGLRRAEIREGGLDILNQHAHSDGVTCCFLGPSCYDDLEQAIAIFRSAYPTTPLAVVLDNEIYAAQAVELRRVLAVRIMPLADIAQMAGFILDAENQSASGGASSGNRGVISVVHFKGGVGCSTVAAALASCWARHDVSVALIDLDDVNPQITAWARVGTSQRHVMSDLLHQGEVPKYCINELVHPVEGYDGKLVVVPQPERYQESFHFKADMLEGAPSSSIFMESLISTLRDEFDVIVIDAADSWGIASFTVLPLSQQVLLVSDDDGMSVRCTLDNLQRLANESDDPDEFDLSRWNMVLNAYSGRLLSPKDLGLEIQEMELFPESAVLYSIPFSEKGRQWGAPGQSFYDMAEAPIKAELRRIAFDLIPFRQEVTQPLYDKIFKEIRKVVGNKETGT